MKIIHRYVINHFVLFLFTVVLTFVVLYLSVDFSEKFDDLMSAKVSWPKIALYFAFKIPFIVDQIIMPAGALATVVTYLVLYYRKELVAFYTAGGSPRRLSFAIVGVGVVISFSHLILSDLVTRPSKIKADEIWMDIVKKSSDLRSPFSSKVKAGEVWYASRHKIYHFRYYDPAMKSFHKVSINNVDDDFQLVKRIDAETMVWDGNQWLLQKAVILDFTNGLYDLQEVKELQLDISESPHDFRVFKSSIENLSLLDIIHVIALMRREGVNNQAYFLELNIRIVVSLAIGFSIVLSTSILARYTLMLFGEQFKTFFMVMLIFLIFFGLLHFGIALASAGSVPILLGLWTGPLVALIAAVKIMP